MTSWTDRISSQPQVSSPEWLVSNLHLECVMGSRASGCADPDKSDYDIRGVFTTPPEFYFPSLRGLVVGYDAIPGCEHWRASHVTDPTGREFDFELHNLTKFLRLAEENNVNQVDLLFAADELVTHCSPVGRMLLDNRGLFLSKLYHKKCVGYANDQYNAAIWARPSGKRAEMISRFGYDIKSAAHAIRLLEQCRMVLCEGRLDLMSFSAELLEIRRGDWSLGKFVNEFTERDAALDDYYLRCSLPEKPDHLLVRRLLLDCLEHQFGSLEQAGVIGMDV